MAEVEGVVEGRRTDQEGSSVVLRFVLACDDGNRIPVEMRGVKILGILDDGDHVQLAVRGRMVRGREGVARPKRISNLSTQSQVHVARRGIVGRAFNLVFALGVSVVSGVIPVAVGLAFKELYDGASNGDRAPPPFGSPEPGPAGIPFVLISLVVGVAVALVVFFLIYWRRRA